MTQRPIPVTLGRPETRRLEPGVNVVTQPVSEATA
jgi:hypothetical protein